MSDIKSLRFVWHQTQILNSKNFALFQMKIYFKEEGGANSITCWSLRLIWLFDLDSLLNHILSTKRFSKPVEPRSWSLHQALDLSRVGEWVWEPEKAIWERSCNRVKVNLHTITRISDIYHLHNKLYFTRTYICSSQINLCFLRKWYLVWKCLFFIGVCMAMALVWLCCLYGYCFCMAMVFLTLQYLDLNCACIATVLVLQWCLFCNQLQLCL